MECIKETFNPVYNSVRQVKDCVGFMLGEEITDARIAVVIGHNGRNFVSSTDWRLTTLSGAKRILPFSIRPQYPNFVECVAGSRYLCDDMGRFAIIPDAKDVRCTAIVELDGKQFEFADGEALKIYATAGENFVATDCAVSYEERDNVRIYRVLSRNAAYGRLDNAGKISQV